MARTKTKAKDSNEVINIDAAIETRKVVGTELQAYLRQLIREA